MLRQIAGGRVDRHNICRQLGKFSLVNMSLCVLVLVSFSY